MIEKESIDLSEYRLNKAKNLLTQAEVLLQKQMYDGSINRSYYAIFYAIRSLLSLLKLDSTKHSGIISLFDKCFVKTGLIDKKFSNIAHTAFDARQDYDYEDFSIPSEYEAHSLFQNAKIFIDEIERLRTRIVEEEISLSRLC
ncbi:HEPN domain-containing protein [Calditrichota bacterium LG25]